MKIYVAGPMTGLPHHNFPGFHFAAAVLRAHGFEVCNPAEGVTDTTKLWSFYMRRALKMMLDCDAVAVLPGWERSAGASLEVEIARKLGMTVATVEWYCGDNGRPVKP